MSPRQNPVPGLSLPGTQEAASNVRNNNTMLRWAKKISPRMLAVDQPLYYPTTATIPNSKPPTPPTDAYLEQDGWQSVSFGSGTGILTLPKAFPNGILSAQLTVIQQTTLLFVFLVLPWTGTLQEAILAGYSFTGGAFVALTSPPNIAISYRFLGW